MNEETLIAISGIALVIVFAILPAIALQIILYKLYLRFRAAKEKKRLEAQTGSTQKEPSLPPKPASKPRAGIAFTVISLLVIVYGLMIGFAVGVLSNLLYLFFIFPLAIGIYNGKLIADAVEKMKIRKPSQVVILSVLSAVAIYGMLHYGRYVGFQVRASLEIFQDFSQATEEENLQAAKAFMDYALEEETGHSGFIGYMLYKANEGVSIGRLSRSSSFNLGPLLTWSYWLMEFGIILGLTIQKGKKAIGMPFCEACGNWYRGERHLGGTAHANEPALLDLIRQKDFIELGKLLEKNAEVPSVEIYFQGCEVCNQSQAQLIVRRAFQGPKGILQFTDATQTVLQPGDSALLLNQMGSGGD